MISAIKTKDFEIVAQGNVITLSQDNYAYTDTITLKEGDEYIVIEANYYDEGDVDVLYSLYPSDYIINLEVYRPVYVLKYTQTEGLKIILRS